MAEYIGTNVIASTEETANGLKITLSDGSIEYATPSQLEALKSETAYPDTEITRRKWKSTLEAILQLLLDGNMQMQDKDWIMQRIDETLIENFRAAVAKKFGVSTMMNVDLKQIDELLKS